MNLTQHITMHLNGGRDFSELHYEVFADGKPTGITIHKRTDGSPNYNYTSFKVRCGEEEFDVLAAKGKGMVAWIEERARKVLEASNAA